MMSTMKLPIGLQSFPVLRQNNYLYVDKTALLQRLIEKQQDQFLAEGGIREQMTRARIQRRNSEKK